MSNLACEFRYLHPKKNSWLQRQAHTYEDNQAAVENVSSNNNEVCREQRLSSSEREVLSDAPLDFSKKDTDYVPKKEADLKQEVPGSAQNGYGLPAYKNNGYDQTHHEADQRFSPNSTVSFKLKSPSPDRRQNENKLIPYSGEIYDGRKSLPTSFVNMCNINGNRIPTTKSQEQTSDTEKSLLFHTLTTKPSSENKLKSEQTWSPSPNASMNTSEKHLQEGMRLPFPSTPLIQPTGPAYLNPMVVTANMMASVNGNVPYFSGLGIMSSMNHFSGNGLLAHQMMPGVPIMPEVNGEKKSRPLRPFKLVTNDLLSRNPLGLLPVSKSISDYNQYFAPNAPKSSGTTGQIKNDSKTPSPENQGKVSSQSETSGETWNLEMEARMEGTAADDSNGSSCCESPSTGQQADTSTSSKTRKRGRPLPDDVKDDAYWERRRRNNEAAKRSRDSRRQKEDMIALTAQALSEQNAELKIFVASLQHVIAAKESENQNLFEQCRKKDLQIQKLTEELTKNAVCSICRSTSLSTRDVPGNCL